MMLVVRIKAWYISSGLAPASRALFAWEWTDPSDLIAAAAASLIKWAVFALIGPAVLATFPRFFAAVKNLLNLFLILRYWSGNFDIASTSSFYTKFLWYSLTLWPNPFPTHSSASRLRQTVCIQPELSARSSLETIIMHGLSFKSSNSSLTNSQPIDSFSWLLPK